MSPLNLAMFHHFLNGSLRKKVYHDTISLSLDQPYPIKLETVAPKIQLIPLQALLHINTGPSFVFCQSTAGPSLKSKMAFKFVVLAAFLAVASAGGPAAYDIAASSGDHSSIGFSQESTQKGFAGQNVISSYSKSDDSAHSFVRVSSHSVSNDGLLNYEISHTPIVKAAYTAPAYLTPTAAPLIAKTYAAPYSYSAPLVTKAYAAPYSYAASAPLIAKTAVAAPAPLLTKTYAAPLSYAAPAAHLSYAAPAAHLSYAAPTAQLSYAAGAPLLAKSYGYAAHAPVIAKSALIAPAHGYTASIASAPLLTKTYAATPLAHAYAPQAQLISKAYGYEAAAPVVHTVFNGLGTSYAW
ncbi:pupal cuticle protein G1A-like [Bombus vosnesenskii]|uniref:Pupal cuticle protein G1A-like n=2 Tax=Pyrobombus TaxID=144703 RepID=A0A6J3KLS0_9HYME|nr:pupal cuticle protein G1A [Bombus impatiens]XP_033354163.1 pupal cuticle protein G1A-like [Bombus vosnesenskii]